MWLHIGVVCTKKLFGGFNSNCFYFIGIFLPTIVTTSGIAFRIFIGKNRPQRF